MVKLKLHLLEKIPNQYQASGDSRTAGHSPIDT